MSSDSNLNTQPSTLRGIQKRAKKNRRPDQTHTQSLESAAQAAGFKSFRQAKQALAAKTPTPAGLNTIYLSAYWRDTRSAEVTAGLQTISISLPRPLEAFITRHQCGYARGLEGFRIEYSDHVELQSNADSLQRAHEQLTRAALALQFIEATNLRPATSVKQHSAMEHVRGLPRKDHASLWINSENESWVVLDEPYDVAIESGEVAKRSAWATSNGFTIARPSWSGLYFPGRAHPHLVSRDAELVQRVSTLIFNLVPVVGLEDASLKSQSLDYRAQFTSPARIASGSKRKPRPGTRYGYSKNAIQHQVQPGHDHTWRPFPGMDVELHVEAGNELKSLAISAVLAKPARRIENVRSTLEDWIYAENSGKSKVNRAYEYAYYDGESPAPCSTVQEQIQAVDRVITILRKGYLESKPQHEMIATLLQAKAEMA